MFPLGSEADYLSEMERAHHQPSRNDQIDQSQISDVKVNVRVNLRSNVGRFGPIVRVGGTASVALQQSLIATHREIKQCLQGVTWNVYE